MTAQIIYMADHRAKRARIEMRLTLDPLACWLAWWRFMTGGRT